MAGHQTGRCGCHPERRNGGNGRRCAFSHVLIHVLGVKEIMVIGHTGCGMEMFTEEKFEDHIHTQCGVWAVSPDKFHCYSDVNQATQKQVLKLRSHPWIPSEVVIRGFVFDLATGELREVTPKDEH